MKRRAALRLFHVFAMIRRAMEAVGMAEPDKPISFLFMDERYPDQHLPPHLRATTLTGMLVRAADHRKLRDGYYELVAAALGDDPHTVSMMPLVHASNLFPGADDDARFTFLAGLAHLVKSLGIQIIRVGYTEQSIRVVLGAASPKQFTLSLLFNSVLFALERHLQAAMIWPVMEIDRTDVQDAAFAGLVQNVDYYASRIGPQNVSIDNRNLGELLYTTKRSASGAIVDCLAYLLHARTLRDSGAPLTKFKERLAGIADELCECIALNEILDLQLGSPPAGQHEGGPIRYALPITPTDPSPGH